MNTSADAYTVIFPIIGWALFVALLAVNDRIIRHVCERESRTYSPFWMLRLYWLWRSTGVAWFGEARSAGYLPIYATLLVLLIGLVAAVAYFRLRAGVT